VQSKLDEEIGRQYSRTHPDAFRLTHLKKLRLAVKDELAGHIRPTNLMHSVRDLQQGSRL
jgi:uncharacterized protein YdcH (DUF465 family)